MGLIRVIPRDNVYRKWLRTPASEVYDLMKDPFPEDQQSVSVYEAVTDVEETKVAVAHYLTMVPHRLSFDTVWVLRIKRYDLEGLEIEVDDTEHGTTGVVIVDAKHRNLNGNRDAFAQLVQRIHDAVRHGEDRLRAVGPIQIKQRVDEFVNLTNDEVDDRTKNRCRILLENSG